MAARVSEAIARQALRRTMTALEGARHEIDQLTFCAKAQSCESQAQCEALLAPVVALLHETEDRLRTLAKRAADQASDNTARAHGIKL